MKKDDGYRCGESLTITTATEGELLRFAVMLGGYESFVQAWYHRVEDEDVWIGFYIFCQVIDKVAVPPIPIGVHRAIETPDEKRAFEITKLFMRVKPPSIQHYVEHGFIDDVTEGR